MTPTPLPCGWTPDPADVAMRRMDAAGAAFVAAWQATDDPDLMAAADATFAAALDAIEADIDRETTTATTTGGTP